MIYLYNRATHSDPIWKWQALGKLFLDFSAVEPNIHIFHLYTRNLFLIIYYIILHLLSYLTKTFIDIVIDKQLYLITEWWNYSWHSVKLNSNVLIEKKWHPALKCEHWVFLMWEPSRSQHELDERHSKRSEQIW